MHACLVCNSSTNCFTCSPDHFLSGNTGNDSCTPCLTGCSTCVSSSNCTNCHIGYYHDVILGSGSCILCAGNCITCTSSTDCLSCDVGYYLSGTSCLSCNSLIDGCLSCYEDTSHYCLSCELGMSVSSDSLSCVDCPMNCTSCNDT